MTSLSTHVLDTEQGIPAAGVRVELYRGEQPLAQRVTNADGRIATLSDEPLGPDIYRLVFDVAAYYAAQGRRAPFFERVSVDFRVGASDRHFHIPLLLSPYACTTYRGS
jgi:5-hydroxyisourate hydrolase